VGRGKREKEEDLNQFVVFFVSDSASARVVEFGLPKNTDTTKCEQQTVYGRHAGGRRVCVRLTIVNPMITQLGRFTAEVTRVAAEVGTDGKSAARPQSGA